MRNLLGFFANFLLAMVFLYDAMDYYFLDGINIINNNVNRVFIMWLGLITTVYSSAYFIYQSQFKNK